MYEVFYGFKIKPFSMLPDPGFLYPSKKHRMAQTLLEYGLVNQASFCVVTGGIGTGKTTLIRNLLNNLDKNITIGLLSNTHASFGELMEWILLAFNLESPDKSKVSMFRSFSDFLISEYAKNRRSVLIIDEAQNMSHETLEELRMLSNINSERDQLLQIILVGQPNLRELLQNPKLEQFAQRIGVDYHLEALNEMETLEYIRHRISIAGGKNNIFTDAACAEIYKRTNGIPRLINQLCDTSLVYGFADQTNVIDIDIVRDVASERQKGGILPVVNQTPEQQGPYTGSQSTGSTVNRKVSGDNSVEGRRVALVTESRKNGDTLINSLRKAGMDVVAVLPFNNTLINALDDKFADILLVDLDEQIIQDRENFETILDDIVENCKIPIFFNESNVNDEINRNVKNISRTLDKTINKATALSKQNDSTEETSGNSYMGTRKIS